jgi:hypothetical protein
VIRLNLSAGFARLGSLALQGLDNIHAVNDLAEYNVLAVEPDRKDVTNPEKERKKHQAASLRYHSVLAVQMKNWLPLVFGPALAMDRMPKKKSSATLIYIHRIYRL